MQKLRWIFIVLAAPAVVLLGLNQLGGTSLSKGYDTGFNSEIQYAPHTRLAISTDTGDLDCWVKLRVPANASSFSAKLSTGAPLWVYQEGAHGSEQWIAIVADGQKPQEKFKWPSGASLLVNNNDNNATSLTPSDWRVFLSDKDYDSRDRASWRRMLFNISLALLGLALVGGGLEAYSKLKERTPPFTSQRCIQELISTTEGATGQETEWMQAVLTKVLLEGVPVADALAPLALRNIEKKAFWFKTRNQFRSRLARLISDLNMALSYLYQ